MFQAIALVLAVEGNNDAFRRFPIQRREEIGGRRVLVRHIFGEPHQLRANPRSAGPRRFSLPRTVGRLRLRARRIDAKIVQLD